MDEESTTQFEQPKPTACPLCGSAALQQRHCKVICPNCGYVESCEDLFPFQNETPAPERDRPKGAGEIFRE